MPGEEEVYLKVRVLAPGGAFVGEMTGSPPSEVGMKGFVRFAIPGETIVGVITGRKERHLEVELSSVKAPSASRCIPRCPVFGSCGGCDLQHMTIHAQREAKRIMVEDFLKVQAAISPEQGVIFHEGSLPDYGYRRRVTLHSNGKDAIGFYRHTSHVVVPSPVCPISTSSINRVLDLLDRQEPALAQKVEELVIEEAFGLTIAAFSVTTKVDPFDAEFKNRLEEKDISLFIRRKDTVLYRSHGIPAFFQPGHFSQVNEEANKMLVDFVSSLITSGGAVDLYAGSGNFAFVLAKRGISVTAVESDSYLVGIGRKQAKDERLSDFVSFVQGRAEEFAPHMPHGSHLILDPPRKGAKEVVSFLRPERTPRIVYVSCFLPALARDLRSLVRSGYKVKSVTCIDMFPQTAHVESVAVLEE